MNRPSRCLLALLIAGSLLSPVAVAQVRDPARADALFREGRDAMRRNDVEVACAKFSESQRLDPGTGTLLNLSECEERLGRVGPALRHVRDALGQIGPKDPRARIAKERVAALEHRMGRLVVRLAPSVPSAARVLRDDEEMKPADLGTPILVDPGPHVLLLREGGAEKRFEITLAESESREITLELPPPAPPAVVPKPEPPAPSATVPPQREPAPPPSPPPPPPVRGPTLGYVVLGVGVVGFVVSGITGAVLLHKKSIVDHDCDRDAKTCDGLDGVDAAHTGKPLVPVFYGAAAIGLVGVVAGTYLVLTSGPRGDVGLILGPTGAGVRGAW